MNKFNVRFCCNVMIVLILSTQCDTAIYDIWIKRFFQGLHVHHISNLGVDIVISFNRINRKSKNSVIIAAVLCTIELFYVLFFIIYTVLIV